jgi:hypothetical protein
MNAVCTCVQRFALIFGIVYALVGLLGFVPGVLQPPPADAPRLAVGTADGYLLGAFPVYAGPRGHPRHRLL